MSFPLFFVTFHQHCLVTCGCLTTMPKQSNGIPILIYIFDRTPRKSKEFVPSSVLFYFHSYVCPFVNFGCLVFTSSLWWHLRHQVKRFIERSRNGIYIMYIYVCVPKFMSTYKIHDTFACLFWILPLRYIWWKLNKETSNLNFPNCL